MSSDKIQINAVAYREGDAWIAQGIEYDIVAHALDVLELPDAFTKAVVENICITRHLGREPLAGIKPAPKRFRSLFKNAGIEVRPTKQSDAAEVAVRVAA